MSSSSSGNSTPLSNLQFTGASTSDPFLDDAPARKSSLPGSGSKLLDAFQDKSKEINERSDDKDLMREKGKAKMIVEDVPACRETGFEDNVKPVFVLAPPRLIDFEVSRQLSIRRTFKLTMTPGARSP